MRISDWSSDVCSSDLLFDPLHHTVPGLKTRLLILDPEVREDTIFYSVRLDTTSAGLPVERTADLILILTQRPQTKIRSEEHTSELQSLMRISYAVFCLKKKNKNNKTIPPCDINQTYIITSSHQISIYMHTTQRTSVLHHTN